jgi:hypothetical protein
MGRDKWHQDPKLEKNKSKNRFEDVPIKAGNHTSAPAYAPAAPSSPWVTKKRVQYMKRSMGKGKVEAEALR